MRLLTIIYLTKKTICSSLVSYTLSFYIVYEKMTGNEHTTNTQKRRNFVMEILPR